MTKTISKEVLKAEMLKRKNDPEVTFHFNSVMTALVKICASLGVDPNSLNDKTQEVLFCSIGAAVSSSISYNNLVDEYGEKHTTEILSESDIFNQAVEEIA